MKERQPNGISYSELWYHSGPILQGTNGCDWGESKINQNKTGGRKEKDTQMEKDVHTDGEGKKERKYNKKSKNCSYHTTPMSR